MIDRIKRMVTSTEGVTMGETESNDPQFKVCKQCGESKPVDAFYRDKNQDDGRHARCKQCEKSRESSEPSIELIFPDPNRKPGNLPDKLIQDIRRDRGSRGLTETNADDKGLSIPALMSKYSDVYYDGKKYTLTWRMVHDILAGRIYAGVESGNGGVGG